MADRVGQQFGNYRLISLLGQGGYAKVYLGQHVRFNQQAAIKVLHAHLTEQEVEHFQHEAETIATLAHPSIVRVFDFDVEEGVPFLVMDYAPNGSLRRRYPKSSIVPLSQIVSYVKQVATALQYAHEQKFIHRDVKPENMLLGRHQEVLLSDFGMAALAHSTSSLSANTQATGGTISYMAPEQIEGHPRAASDQYALGVVVYEWLCGARPFEGSVSEVMVQHLSMPPPPLRERLPTISPEVEQAVLRALAKEPKERFASVQEFAAAMEQASLLSPSQAVRRPLEQPSPGPVAAPSYTTVADPLYQPVGATEATTPAEQLPGVLTTPQSQAADETPLPGQFVAPRAAAAPMPADVPLLPKPAIPIRQRIRHLSGTSAVLLIGLAVLVIAGGVLAGMSLLSHLSSGTTPVGPVRGGTWTDDLFGNMNSLLPNSTFETPAGLVDQALYLPLFYGDAQGVLHPGAAREVPTLQNSGISTDAKTWTFHLRPGLVWSDGQPYDARDVDYTWKLTNDPTYGANFPYFYSPPDLIHSADVSPDNLSITFHLNRPYVPFLQYWIDGAQAPLPAHLFSAMAPGKILKSSESLNPTVVSGPFMMAESVPGDHYTLIRNPRYYRAKEGLPYLDKIVFRVATQDDILKDLQAGTINSSWFLDVSKIQAFQHFTGYTLVTTPTSVVSEGMFLNFHNIVLASHLEVRQAMAMAIDHQALIRLALHGFATSLCTDHASALHPGYDPDAPCPVFDPAAANKLLDDNGWVRGPDGVRARDGQRLEFEYSASVTGKSWHYDVETIVRDNLNKIGIKLDIQNYPDTQFFLSLLPGGKASPPTGAVAGRYDIAELGVGWTYDPDDSTLLSCDQFPPKGFNIDFYCNRTLDALYQQELVTPDPGQRQNIFHQIHEIYLRDFPFIVFFSTLDISIVRKGMHNYLPSPTVGETDNIWEWWCDRGTC